MSTYSPEDLIALLRRFALERERYVKRLARDARTGRAEFDALDLIEEAGELTPNQLSERLCLTSGATTALIDRLESAGTVTRSPHPTDCRSLLIRLTQRSYRAGATQLAPYLNDLRAAADRLSEAECSAAGTFLEAATAVAVKHAGIESSASTRPKNGLPG